MNISQDNHNDKNGVLFCLKKTAIFSIIIPERGNAMKETFILAIDQGTTSTRSIIFNRKSQIVSSSQMEISQICPQNGWVEQNPEEIFETVIQTIKEALNQAHLGIDSIEALGITNQRETTILWDKISGKPLYRAIVWQSRQSTAICETWINKGYQKRFTRRPV